MMATVAPPATKNVTKHVTNNATKYVTNSVTSNPSAHPLGPSQEER
jgi:hypothetical protein